VINVRDKDGTPLAAGDAVLFRLAGRTLEGIALGLQQGPYVVILYGDGEFGILPERVTKVTPDLGNTEAGRTGVRP